MGNFPINHINIAPSICYTTKNGLAENTIRSLFVDMEGNVWIGGRAIQETERKRIAHELHDGLGQEFIIISNRA